MVKKFFRIIQTGLAATVVLWGMSACTDDHFDVQDSGDGLDANATLTLWEQITARKDLTRFASILEQTPYFKDETHLTFKDKAKTVPYTYKDVLSGTQILTVFAPTDDAISDAEYQQYLTLLKGSTSDKYDVYLRLVGNHICRNRFTATGTGNEKLVMINGKKATFSRDGKTFKDIPLLSKDGEPCYNIPAVNGTLHLIDEQSSFSYNIYEYIKANGDQYSRLKDWITQYDTVYLNTYQSVEYGSDENGMPIYVDSVYTRTNILFHYGSYSKTGEKWIMNIKTFAGNLEAEDSVWAIALPTDVAFDNAFAENAKYYKYAQMYVDKDKEDDNQDVTIPDGHTLMNADSLSELSRMMDLTSSLLFNIRMQPRKKGQSKFWTAEEFQSESFYKLFNTQRDTFFVGKEITKNENVLDKVVDSTANVKNLIFDNNIEPVTVSNGLLYPVNNWNFFKSYQAKDVEVKVWPSNILNYENMTTAKDYISFNNETSKLVQDSLLGRVSEDCFMTFSYGDNAPSVELKLIDNQLDHQILSGVTYELGIAMVPDFYRWDTDSIMGETENRKPIWKNKMKLEITYNNGTTKTDKYGTPSPEDKTKTFFFEYNGERVDTIWLGSADKATNPTGPMEIEFPISYKNIKSSYPTIKLSSNATKTNVTGANAVYQHPFSVDRIILRAKE